MAQLAEQLICNQQVIGSSPIIGFYTISYCIYGQIPEWPKGTDCKSAANCFGGSNPPPSISRKACTDSNWLQTPMWLNSLRLTNVNRMQSADYKSDALR